MDNENERPFTVDVVLLTKNSMKPCLPECVRSIYKNIPVNRLIVVDGGSNDGTIRFLKTFPNVTIIDDTKGNRATARQIGINAVKTEWFLFVDSDVILSNDWFNEAWKNVNYKVGAVQGFDYPIGDKSISDFGDAMEKLRKQLHKPVRQHPFVVRGFTGDVLIRTSIIKDIRIPPFLHFYEDQFIRRFIENKGFKWIITKNPFCYHYKTMNEMIKDAFPSGFFGYKMRFLTLRKSVTALFTIIPKVIYAFVLKRNPLMVKAQIKFQVLYTLGVLKAWCLCT
ncbi:MAG: glycosyltransferase family A protein [Nitrososphaerota archaeon]